MVAGGQFCSKFYIDDWSIMLLLKSFQFDLGSALNEWAIKGVQHLFFLQMKKKCKCFTIKCFAEKLSFIFGWAGTYLPASFQSLVTAPWCWQSFTALVLCVIARNTKWCIDDTRRLHSKFYLPDELMIVPSGRMMHLGRKWVWQEQSRAEGGEKCALASVCECDRRCLPLSAADPSCYGLSKLVVGAFITVEKEKRGSNRNGQRKLEKADRRYEISSSNG